MPLLHLPCSQLRPAISAAALRRMIVCSYNVPARDRIIDFGKHKGRMLGCLPSSYLKWVSKNLYARDFDEWARLANEVLQDPVYRDRMEWEVAERILTGNFRRSFRIESPVEELFEVSDRFGWDMEDRLGWARIDFNLLGTSNGGRIPRVGIPPAASEDGRQEQKGGISRPDSKVAGGSRRRREKKSAVWGGRSIASRTVDAGPLESAQRPTGGWKDGIFVGKSMVSSDLQLKREKKSILSTAEAISSRSVDTGSSEGAQRPTGGWKGGIFVGKATVSSNLQTKAEKKSIVSAGDSIASRSVDVGSSKGAGRPTGGWKAGIFVGKATVSKNLQMKRGKKSIVSADDSIVSSKGKMGTFAVDSTSTGDGSLIWDSKSLRDEMTASRRKVGSLREGRRYVIEEEEEDDADDDDDEDEDEEEEWKRMREMVKGGSREERKESRRFKREQQLQMLRREAEVEGGSGRSNETFVKNKGVLRDEQVANLFPGRRALLEKVRREGQKRGRLR